MTGRLLFRSKSSGVTPNSYSPSTFSLYHYEDLDEQEEEDKNNNNNNKIQIVDIVVGVLKKSLITCAAVETLRTADDEEDDDDVAPEVDIGWPTDVRHVSHVTFDRFKGFMGLPHPQLYTKLVPSASASVFGVSANSMRCSFDERGNCVPIILLMLQKQLYSEGGLQAEGIFRINAENSQEVYVWNQLNKGVVPSGIDVHCLAGLIKAWFRELPKGVLDSLSQEQVMHCKSENDYIQLIKLLPPTDAALFEWAINLMADVVHHQSHNKMNAHNIAMVFAPNMTKMADPLTALTHAVQVMNMLKTLIGKTLGQREEPIDSHHNNNTATNITDFQSSKLLQLFSHQQTLNRLESDIEGGTSSSPDAILVPPLSDGVTEGLGFQSKNQPRLDFHNSNSKNKTLMENSRVKTLKNRMRKLGRHPVFQLSKPVKKSGGLATV